MLEKIECEQIVKRLMNILGKNINMMNSEGIIIASGDINRINDFHLGASIAAKEKREIIIDDKNISFFQGCKKGVNIPFYYKGEVQGVVGITGEQSEIKGYGIIVKELVELMMQENERRKEELFHTRAIKNFAKELIKDHYQEELKALKQRADLVSFNYNVKRVVVVGDISNFTDKLKSYGEEAEVKAQVLKQEVVNYIARFNNNEEDIVINLYEDRFIILKSKDKSVREYCIELHHKLERDLGIFMQFSIGNSCEDIKDYSKSYNLASHILELGKKLNPKLIIFKKEDFAFEFILNNLKNEKAELFVTTLLGKEILNLSKEDREELVLTSKALMENKMNIKDASEKLYLHRNTLLYRIKKYKDQNIDMMDVFTCIKLYTYYIFNKLQKIEDIL